MAGKYLMGIDIGTSQSKGVITTFYGEIISYEAVEHDTVSIQPGFFEHDPDKIWYHDFKYLVRALLKKSRIDPSNICAVGISAIGPCVVVADECGRPLRDGILYGIDTRAKKQIKELVKRYGQEFFAEHCGNVLSSQSAGPKLLWIKENEPEIFSRTQMIMTSASYLVYRLTGRNVMDYYTACAGYTPLFDYENMCWDEGMCKEFGCMDKMPELLWSTKQAGKLSSMAAKETGLKEGTIVSTGTCDAAAEAVSVGVVRPGKTMLMLGSTAFMITVLNKPVKDIRMWSAPYLFPGTYSLLGGMSAAGILTKWYLDELGTEHRMKAEEQGADVYQELIQEAQMLPCGCEGLIALPYFSGERTPILDSHAKGVFFGLTLRHQRIHLYRALLESVAYGIRDNFNVLEKYNIRENESRKDGYQKGEPQEVSFRENEIAVVGGGCKNPLWLQIISDVTGKTETVSEVTLGAAYGDAFLAGMAAGQIQNREEIDLWVKRKYRVSPTKAAKEMYDYYFSLYKELYENTKLLMEKLDCTKQFNEMRTKKQGE